MKLKHRDTGDTVEVPPPNQFGHSVIIFNGRIVEDVIYSDDPPMITTKDGRIFVEDEWVAYLIEQLRVGAWKLPKENAR